jgi:hypothetical protein
MFVNGASEYTYQQFPSFMRRLAVSALSILTSVSIATPALAATTYDMECMRNAVEKRESLYVIAFDNYYASARSLMLNRKDRIRNAWHISDKEDRNDEIRSAEKDFRTNERNAAKNRRNADKSAKDMYNNDVKNCKIES